jgi:predicted ribosomally synthesized peptide with SipW-like signal peptide
MGAVGTTALLSAFTGGTLAIFTDTKTITNNQFTNTTVTLTTNPTTALVSYSNMLPGDSTTAAVVVTNTSSVATVRYAVSSSATNTDALGLKDQLTLVIKTIDVTTPGVPCDNFDGTQLYTGDLDSSAGKLIGDNAQGAQAGDRSLAAGVAETLCFQVTLPSGTSNSYKNATTTATFTFDAEQTKNNP